MRVFTKVCLGLPVQATKGLNRGVHMRMDILETRRLQKDSV